MAVEIRHSPVVAAPSACAMRKPVAGRGAAVALAAACRARARCARAPSRGWPGSRRRRSPQRRAVRSVSRPPGCCSLDFDPAAVRFRLCARVPRRMRPCASAGWLRAASARRRRHSRSTSAPRHCASTGDSTWVWYWPRSISTMPSPRSHCISRRPSLRHGAGQVRARGAVGAVLDLARSARPRPPRGGEVDVEGAVGVARVADVLLLRALSPAPRRAGPVPPRGWPRPCRRCRRR